MSKEKTCLGCANHWGSRLLRRGDEMTIGKITNPCSYCIRNSEVHIPCDNYKRAEPIPPINKKAAKKIRDMIHGIIKNKKKIWDWPDSI